MKVKLPKTVASPQDLSALILEIKEYANRLEKKRFSNFANQNI